MSRKLVLLNLVLVALACATAWQVRKNWLDARARERALLAKKVEPVPAPAVSAPAAPAPIEAAGYVVVAEKMLFSRDRNPDVVIESTPPKPTPPFPEAFGVIDFGSGASAILAEKPGADQKSYRAGDKIGDFKIASLSTTDIVFEWEGKTFEKTIAELKPKDVPPPPGAAAAAGAAPGAAASSVALGQAAEGGPRPNIPTPSRVVEQEQRPKGGGPGLDIKSPTLRACVPGDSTPPGTVQAGWRKVVSQSPFGQSCRWELVQ